jgi:hypothetical protein
MKHKNCTLAMVKVTPELATKWLANPARNRTVGPTGLRNVHRYARDMISDRWKQTYEPVRFDVEGKLMDGQHRMLAVIEAKRPVEFLVVKGLDGGVITCIDVGLIRKVAQILQIEGFENTFKMASCIAMVDSILNGGRRTLSVDEVMGIVGKHKGILWVMSQQIHGTAAAPLFPSPISAAFALLYGKHPEKAAEYLEEYRDGTAKKGSPLWVLREYMRVKAGKALDIKNREITARKALSAFTYALKGQTIKKLQDGYEGVRYIVTKAKIPEPEDQASP